MITRPPNLGGFFYWAYLLKLAKILTMIQSWNDAGKHPEASKFIHPSGVDEKEYNKTGKEAADLVKSLLPKKSKKVLEYGCGNGRIMKHLKKDVTGVDIVPEFVEAVKSLDMPAYLVNDYDPEEEFDAVYSYTVFIHLDRVDSRLALEYIYKALKKGGTALLQIPIYDKPRIPDSWIDVCAWTELEFIEIMSEIGFEVVELYKNEGEFSYENIGANHNKYQILKKP